MTTQYNNKENHTPGRAATAPVALELLAPARDAEIAMAAIDHGADAVYMGAPSHGARKSAANSLSDIARTVAYAHRFGARVYVTVNTIVYDSELADVQSLVWDLYRIGVDALIVQDMALLMMNLPPIPLHASTQCDIRTPEKARFLEEAGFSQLVLPRELSAKEIRAFSEATTVPLEGFVHGALCVSFSGDCQASQLMTGRSANRGECSQICRYAFDLEDGSGRKYVTGKHLLSLKDMNRLAQLGQMADAGISSFKIEGRLKDAAYVKNVVAAYNRALNEIVAASEGRYVRSSRGEVELLNFIPDLAKSFNRGYTSYFLTDRNPAPRSMSSMDSPKSIGQPVGRVKALKGPRQIVASLTAELANGDGLGFFGDDGRFQGFRLNRVEGDRLFTASDVAPRPGTKLYRNFDKMQADRMERPTAARRITVDMLLRATPSALVLEVTEPAGGLTASASIPYEPQEAKSPQTEARRRTLAKMGDTEFRLGELTDRLGSLFVAASQLATLRRDALEAMRTALEATNLRDRRRHRSPRLSLNRPLTRHDNVANHLAAEFYAPLVEAPVKKEAVEVCAPTAEAEPRVMQTRYCIRRELGACLKTPDGKTLPADLYLTSGPHRFRLRFNCADCCMNVHLVK